MRYRSHSESTLKCPRLFNIDKSPVQKYTGSSWSPAALRGQNLNQEKIV